MTFQFVQLQSPSFLSIKIETCVCYAPGYIVIIYQHELWYVIQEDK